jgi:integrase
MKIETLQSNEGYTVRCGHAVVRLKPITRGKYTTWRLAWKIGKRTFRRGFNDETKALSEAERVARSLSNANGAATTVAGEDIVYFNECRKKLGDVPLHVAVDFYLKYNAGTASNKTLSEIWDAFLQDLKNRQLSNRHINGSRYVKKVLDPLFGERRVSNLQPTEIIAWLNECKYGLVSRANIFRAYAAVMRFAKRQKFVTRAIEELLEEVQITSPKEKTPTFYTPEELMKIFIACPSKEHLLYVAAMAFSGTRRAEFCRMDGRAIIRDERMIRMGPEITKTNTGRALDITENFAAWLDVAWDGRQGRLLSNHNLLDEFKPRLKEVGVEPKQNALRHSFCSYHLALHRNAAMTAEIAGNSPVMLNKHYKALVSKKAAEEWFSITPDVVKTYAKEKGLEKLLTW